MGREEEVTGCVLTVLNLGGCIYGGIAMGFSDTPWYICIGIALMIFMAFEMIIMACVGPRG